MTLAQLTYLAQTQIEVSKAAQDPHGAPSEGTVTDWAMLGSMRLAG